MKEFDAIQRLMSEWPTWLLLVVCYGGWTLVILLGATGGLLWLLVVIPLVTLHSSLQHELLHGHPTRSRVVNEVLSFPALGLFVPYRRFRSLHIAHHHDEHLTDPFDDPESWYLADDDWQQTGRILRLLLSFNATLLGRLLIGPALGLIGFWRSDWVRLRHGETGVLSAWLLHMVALVPVVVILHQSGIDLAIYAACVAYPAMSLLMVRTFVEHRAAEPVAARTAVVETGPLLSLLFLNNNLHAVHHREPSLSWFALPACWRRCRESVLDENESNHFPGGYGEVAARWLLKAREPVVHPHVNRSARLPTHARTLPNSE